MDGKGSKQNQLEYTLSLYVTFKGPYIGACLPQPECLVQQNTSWNIHETKKTRGIIAGVIYVEKNPLYFGRSTRKRKKNNWGGGFCKQVRRGGKKKIEENAHQSNGVFLRSIKKYEKMNKRENGSNVEQKKSESKRMILNHH